MAAKGSSTYNKTAVQVGPFTGGLNNVSRAGEARDTEVVDLVNFEVSVDESLTSRPPIEAISGSTLPSTNTIGWEILGVYRVTTDEWYLVVVVPTDGTTNVNTTVKAYLNGIIGTGETVLTVKNSVGIINKVTSMVQFKEWVYFNVNTGATDTGFRWSKTSAASSIASMPRGSVMISWKTRLWISGTGENLNGDRVYFSTIDATGPHPETWGASDFFDVAPGEGGFITALVPSFNNLIIFKTDGTWRFAYPSKPAQGIVDKISGNVGCSGKNAVVEFENYMYVYDQGRVYEMVNSNFTQINRFVEFDLDPLSVDSVADGVELSILNRRLIVRYFNAVYCFNIDTKAWSQWRTYNGTPGRFYEMPSNSSSADASEFFAASRGTMQSVSSNMIEDASFADATIRAARAAVTGATVTYSGISATITRNSGTPTMLLNTTGSTTDYDLRVATSQQFTAQINVTASNVSTQIIITWLLANGSSSTSNSTIFSTVGLKTFDFTAPAGAILAHMGIRLNAAGATTFDSPNFFRKSAVAPFNIMKTDDRYPDQVAAVEYIDCYFQTKSYDYRTPSNFKKLFWAGIDVKTFRDVNTEIRPVSRVAPITWGDLQAYTHQQLEQGSFGNPLSWLNVSFEVTNILEADEVASENGRYFKKLGKALRFRQISYVIKMSTLGNKPTGPVKFFSLTTYVATKQEVVDSST
jgi:hypothetical protein